MSQITSKHYIYVKMKLNYTCLLFSNRRGATAPVHSSIDVLQCMHMDGQNVEFK